MPPFHKTVECPQCNKSVLLLWSNGSEAFCEHCYWRLVRQLPNSEQFKVIIAPIHKSDGMWDSDSRVRFPELRQFIDECLGNVPPSCDGRLLTRDARVLESLIIILELLVPPDVAAEGLGDLANAATREQILETQNRSVRRLRRNFEMARRGDSIAVGLGHLGPRQPVQWRILAPAGHARGDFDRYCEHRKQQRPQQFVAERLTMIYDRAKPDELYEGTDSFEGYLVFVYHGVNKAVMECGEIGNAIFVVNADRWQFLSHLSKTELLFWHSDEIRSYAHVGCWENATRSALRYAGLMGNNEL